MPRCVPTSSMRRRRLIGLGLIGPACAAIPAHAQERVQRPFPAQALRGTLKVIAAPEVLLDGQPARLAPGARIRGPQNLLVMSASVTGQTLPVHYTRDFDGLLKDLWILRPDEIARFWPRSAAEAAQYRFDPVAQTWSR